MVIFDQFRNLGQREKIAIVSIIVFTFIITSIIARYLTLSYPKGTTVEVSNVITPTPIRDTAPQPIKISLNSEDQKITVGNSINIALTIDTAIQQVDLSDLHIRYDPHYLQPLGITGGSFFSVYPILQTEKSSIHIVGMASKSGNTIFIPKGAGTLAVIRFLPLKVTSGSLLTFDRANTKISLSGVPYRVNLQSTSLEIQP